VGARESYALGTFCWVDLVTADKAAAARFYGELLGWEIPEGERHVHCRLRGRDVAGLYSLPDTPPRWTSYVAVEDADATAARAAALGGTVVEEPFDVGPEGRRAVVADPAGARVALWQARSHPGAGLVNDVGCWCSNQLQAPDPPLAFYREWLGWEVEEAGDGYWAVRNAGADNGGILAADGPPAWLVYFHVEDADDATRSAQAAGAAVLLAPETIGLGRIAILADPQGAAFGLFAGATDP
jgi:predicted enzyme related to lactoylglutathione lyase